jgi:mRNA interferase RelE/StbE
VAEVWLTRDAISDLEQLDGGVVQRVLKKMAILRTNPEAGQPLGSKPASNLTGFRKLLVADRQYRVVYRVDKDGVVCGVWVVAGRVDNECYELALQRLRQHGSDAPEILDLAALITRLRPRTGERALERLNETPE